MANQLVKVGNVMTPAVTRVLTPAQYGDLAAVPPELEWLANITNPKTREAYRLDVREFMGTRQIRGILYATKSGVPVAYSHENVGIQRCFPIFSSESGNPRGRASKHRLAGLCRVH